MASDARSELPCDDGGPRWCLVTSRPGPGPASGPCTSLCCTQPPHQPPGEADWAPSSTQSPQPGLAAHPWAEAVMAGLTRQASAQSGKVSVYCTLCTLCTPQHTTLPASQLSVDKPVQAGGHCVPLGLLGLQTINVSLALVLPYYNE